ncbi:hypothetical protein MIMGU_mgv1a024502mg [Erythranthe guttata]|uniref:Homeobox-leucine zipper protein n=1 Tax=Erythranthe guttata TaxID=4155 RepID=A0A022QXY4_ERYGU|nr:hypothetical protein MIMGU_mgv1a024502mg [Erythranthe guttata]
MSTTSAKNSNKNNKRRFSDEQIQSLETTFGTESRPELRLKHHLADKLGLQPRQIAIWFQNKRARSKSKMIEQEYSELKSSYDNLALQFEALRKENQTLLIQEFGIFDLISTPNLWKNELLYCGLQRIVHWITPLIQLHNRANLYIRQVQRLRKMTEKSDGEENDHENQITPPKTSENPTFLLDMNNHDMCVTSCSDLNRKIDYLEEDAADILNMAEIAEDSLLASPENGCSFDSCAFLDNTAAGGTTSQWWDF